MTTPKQKRGGKEPSKPEASVTSMKETDKTFEITVRVRNPLDRAIHYIAEVRAMVFDPATRRLRVQLSDQGRETPLGGMFKLPRIRQVDPQSEAAISLPLPKTIVKLAATTTPGTEVAFEEHAISDADQIELEIGWSDTPFYADPREASRATPPVKAWEQDTIRTSYTPPARQREPRQ
jgi:hypothetical protein